MEKNFDEWNKLKKKIDADESDLFIKNRQVWWCSIGLNIGSEQNGHGDNFERPVLVLRKYSAGTFLGIPLTSKQKEGNYYFKLEPYFGVISYAILSQAKVIDRRRVRRMIYEVNHQEYQKIIERYKSLF
ncbi:MAG: type II toxin-antitoxin system PemK/MazF family toxin [Candidatus Vogelbacteria bacterium]|nr:type II toxin-antitoxin system PemK/MazF family toxin [Candidatus Vogelbacteria bacterium]